jgi:hypothetical protein
VTTNYLYPFIDRFSDSIRDRNLTIQIKTTSNLFTDVGLFCRYSIGGSLKNSKASFVNGNLSVVSCFMEVTQLTSNTELVSFDLYMNVSNENSKFNFILTSNNLTFVYLKEPIQINIPATITPQYFNQNFSLNFSDPQQIPGTKISFNQYKLKLIPEYSSLNPSKYVYCEFKSLLPQCMIQNLSLTHTPMRLDYTLEVTSPFFSDVVNFITSSNLFKDNVTFITELPYAGDSITNQNSTFTVEFNVSRKLHPLYSFYCQVYSQNIPIVRTANEGIFTCSFNTRGFEENVAISLFIANNTVSGLAGMISNQDSIVQMVVLKFSPEFSAFQENTTLSIQKNNSISFVVPSVYRGYPHKIVSANTNTFNCSIVSGLISCSKTNIPPQISVDIYLLNFKIQYQKPTSGFVDFMNIRQGLILYENHEISNIFPLATLAGNNINLELKFDGRALKNLFTQKIDFYCQYNKSNSLSTKVDDQTLNCPVTYNDHNASSIQLKSFFKIPSLSGEKEIFITLNESSTKFYYLTPGSIQFSSSNQIQFFYTSTDAAFLINITTFIPSNLVGFITAKLSDASGFSPVNNFTGSSGNTNQFKSITSTTFGGKKALTLWYKQSSHSFQISSNSLEVIFAVPSQITGLSPVAAIVNRTTTLTVSTVFDTSLDYGDANFTCKYGPNMTRFASNVTAIKLQGAFTCDVEGSIEGKAYISLWMTSKGIERKISTTEELFSFISSDFLNPSYGFPTGGQTVKIDDYKRVSSNITFSDATLGAKYLFLCEKNNTSLTCVTPALQTDVLSFNSYELNFTAPDLFGRKLSVKWINYEERELNNYYPQVVSSSDATFSMNITLNKAITIQKNGELILVFAAGTNYRKDISYGTLSNQINVVQDMTPLKESDPKGTYEIRLYYKNEDSIEFRSMIPISKPKNITILTASPIDFVNGTNNIGYINELTNFTVTFTDSDNAKLLNEHRQKVECKLGNSFVKTFYNSNKPKEYICLTSSTTELVGSLTLWYRDPQAYRGEIQVSSNPLDILFVKSLNVTSVLPFASIGKSQQLTLSSTLNNDVYGSKVEYQCIYDGQTFAATLSGLNFQCSISTMKTIAFNQYVTMKIKSKATGISIPLSSNQDSSSEFYFLNQISTDSMIPFSQGHRINGTGLLTTNVSLSISQDLMLTRGVFCQYKSNDGVFYSKAEYVNPSKSILSCQIEKKSFVNELEILSVSLWMNASGINTTFDLTSDSQNYLFIREPLTWNSSKILSQISILNALYLKFPISNGFNYQLNMTPNLDSPVSTSVDCDYTGVSPVCFIMNINLKTVTSLPSDLNFTFYVYHAKSGVHSQGFEVNQLTYYSNMTIEHLKPYVVSFFERNYNPVKIISNVQNQLNSKRFKFKCNVSSDTESKLTDVTFDLTDEEYQRNISQSNHFACLMSTFGSSTNDFVVFKLKLVFVSEFGENIEVTPFAASITAVLKSYPLSTVVGISSGNYPIQQYYDLYDFPTTTYSDYEFTIGMYLKNGYQTLNSCITNNRAVTCQFPNIHDQFSNWDDPKKILLDLRINGVYSKNLVPYFTVQSYIIVYKVIPSQYMKINFASSILFSTSDLDIPVSGIYNFRLQGNGVDATQSCEMISSVLLKCFFPAINNPGSYLMSISIDGKYFQSVEKFLILFDDKIIGIDKLSKSELNFLNSTEIIIEGKNFINNTDIRVSFYDNFVNRVSVGTFINSTHISTIVDPFYDLNVRFPRKLSARISFNAAHDFIPSVVSILVKRTTEFSVSPSQFALGVKTEGIKIVGFPENDLIYNVSKQSLRFRLYYNSTYFIDLNCLTLNSCNMMVSPVVVGFYNVRSGLVDAFGNWNDVFIYSTNQISVYYFTRGFITSVQPNNTFIENSALPISIRGNFKQFKSALFRLTITTNTLFSASTTIIVPGNITNDEANLNVPNINGNSLQVEVSFNGGINYHDVNTYTTLLKSYNLISVKPKQSQDIQNLENFLSTRNLEGFIKGTNFSSTLKEVKLILMNSEGTYDITSFANVKVIDSETIEFNSPRIEYLNITYEVVFPLKMQLGLSFNRGYDFKYLPFIYEKSCLKELF